MNGSRQEVESAGSANFRQPFIFPGNEKMQERPFKKYVVGKLYSMAGADAVDDAVVLQGLENIVIEFGHRHATTHCRCAGPGETSQGFLSAHCCCSLCVITAAAPSYIDKIDFGGRSIFVCVEGACEHIGKERATGDFADTF